MQNNFEQFIVEMQYFFLSFVLEMHAAFRERRCREESDSHAGTDDLRIEVAKRILYSGNID
jgi:hypothetical protein